MSLLIVCFCFLKAVGKPEPESATKGLLASARVGCFLLRPCHLADGKDGDKWSTYWEHERNERRNRQHRITAKLEQAGLSIDFFPILMVSIGFNAQVEQAADPSGNIEDGSLGFFQSSTESQGLLRRTCGRGFQVWRRSVKTIFKYLVYSD